MLKKVAESNFCNVKSIYKFFDYVYSVKVNSKYIRNPFGTWTKMTNFTILETD